MKIHRRIATRLSAAFVFVVVAGGILMGLAVTRSGTDLLIRAAKVQLGQESKIASHRLQDILDTVQRDVEFIVRSPAVREVANTLDTGRKGSEQVKSATQARQRLQDMFAALLNNHPWYAQIRLIGVADEGREVVRVDQVNGQVLRVPDTELQQKGNRPYIQETLNAPPGQVFWSAIDLNRERGQIIEPPQPVLRAATPVEGRRGTPIGIVIINIDIRRVFDVVSEALTPGIALYIANNDGDYLYHPDPGKTFGFERGQRYLMQDDFTAAALHPVSGSILVLEEVIPAGAAEPVIAHLSRLQIKTYGSNNLFIGLTRPRAPILADVKKARQRNATLILPFILAAAALIVWLVRIFIYPLEKVTREVSRFVPGRRSQLPEQNRHDEVGQLAQAFTGMASRIEHQITDLEEQSRRFQSLFEAAPDAVVIIDEDGSVEYTNPATEKLFGYPPDELTGQDITMLMPEPYRSHHSEYMNRYLDGGEPHIIGIGRKVVGMHKNGQALSLYLSIGEFTLKGRRKFTGILHDTSLESASVQSQ